MPIVALLLIVANLAITFGIRSLIQKRRTGSAGFHGLSGHPGSAEWWGGVLLGLAIVALLLAPIADLAGWLGRIPLLDTRGSRTIGLAIVVLGTVLTLLAQVAMGRSWRIGVRADEVTELVTSGPFAISRNPIFATMLLAVAGFALLMPNLLSIAAWLAAFVGIELQVRLVEEPYLLRIHATTYRAYATRVGRFLPWLGRLR